MKRISFVKWLVLIWLLTGCTVAAAIEDRIEPSLESPRPTATLHPLFIQLEGIPTPDPPITGAAVEGQDNQDGLPEIMETPATAVVDLNPPGIVSTPDPTPSSGSQLPSPSLESGREITITVYGDMLYPGWSLQNSYNMSYRLVTGDLVYSGTVGLAATPLADFGALFFTVEPDSPEQYHRARLQRVSFWLNGGDELIDLTDLSVSIVGSNAYPYWVEVDNSVENEDWPIFPETRLYFLDFNHPIPPNTWVRVEVWLDDLIYDPDYEFVTGIYIKSDEDYFNTFYIDEVQLVMVVDE